MSCIVLIGGVPGSGKTEFIRFITTYETELFNNFHNSSNELKLHIISFDEICSVEDQAHISKTVSGWRNFRIQILEASEQYICDICNLECLTHGPLTERSTKIFEDLKTRNGVSSFENNIKKCNIFIVEDNFYYRSMRYEWFQIARRGNIGFCEIFITCPLNLALQRNLKRSYHIPEHLIKFMYSSLELPNSEKNKWEKFSYLFENKDDLQLIKIVDIIKLIEEAIKKPAEVVINENKIIAQKICSKNVIHQADKILRKLAGRIIKDIQEKENLKELASKTNHILAVRQNILFGIRQKNVILSPNLTEFIKQNGITEEVYNQLEIILWEIFMENLEVKS